MRFLLLWLTLSYGTLFAQGKKVEQLRANVVAITASFDNDYVETGFGFIVVEAGDKVLIATAAHVVSKGMGKPDITLRFFEVQDAVKAKVVFLDGDLDVALLSCPKPAGYSWEPDFEGKTPKRGDKVSFVGRDGEWYIPTEAGEGQIKRIRNEEVFVDIVSVTRGTSGAPLITSSGIVGLITHSEATQVTAVSIAKIRSLASGPLKRTEIIHGKSYEVVFLLDGHTWMAQNLDYELPDSWCYDDDPANCRTYGRLYTWEAAKKACADLGWRLPTDAEWKALAKTYGGYFDWETEEDIGDPRKAYSALWENGSSGFSAQLGGGRTPDGDFYGLGRWGDYWSATERAADPAWGYNFDGGKLHRYGNAKSYGRSCRCLQD